MTTLCAPRPTASHRVPDAVNDPGWARPLDTTVTIASEAPRRPGRADAVERDAVDPGVAEAVTHSSLAPTHGTRST